MFVIWNWFLMILPFALWGTSMAAMAPLVKAAGPEIVASLRLLPAGLVVLASVPFLKRSWNISKDDLFDFTVFYDGIPQSADNPPWAGGFTWSKDKDGRDWIAVSCEGEGARIWWPNKDHITAEGDSVRMAYTVPSNMVAVGNGKLRSIKTS